MRKAVILTLFGYVSGYFLDPEGHSYDCLLHPISREGEAAWFYQPLHDCYRGFVGPLPWHLLLLVLTCIVT